MGLSNVPIKIGSLLKSVLIPAALAIGGFSATIAPADAPVAMCEAVVDCMLTIPAAFLILGAFVLIFVYRLPKEKVLQMQKEIDDKKAAEEASAAES